MAIKRCKVCRGAKSIMTLGAIEKKCTACKGIGREIVEEEDDVDAFLEDKKEKKKPGRKKKAD